MVFVYEGKENAIKDREERLRLVREKHDEERQRKLDELKQQVMTYWPDIIIPHQSKFIHFFFLRHWLFKGIENKKKRKDVDV